MSFLLAKLESVTLQKAVLLDMQMYFYFQYELAC